MTTKHGNDSQFTVHSTDSFYFLNKFDNFNTRYKQNMI